MVPDILSGISNSHIFFYCYAPTIEPYYYTPPVTVSVGEWPHTNRAPCFIYPIYRRLICIKPHSPTKAIGQIWAPSLFACKPSVNLECLLCRHILLQDGKNMAVFISICLLRLDFARPENYFRFLFPFWIGDCGGRQLWAKWRQRSICSLVFKMAAVYRPFFWVSLFLPFSCFFIASSWRSTRLLLKFLYSSIYTLSNTRCVDLFHSVIMLSFPLLKILNSNELTAFLESAALS